jgi:hypothetical protein
LSIFLTKSIEREDVDMFDAVAGKLGLELKPIKKLLNRFVHE